MKTRLLLIITIALLSCNGQNTEPTTDRETPDNNTTYTCKEIGWTIEIPEGWEIVTESDLAGNVEKGAEAISEVYEEEIDYSQVKNLVGFKKNDFNIFTSTLQKFEEEYPNEWEAVYQSVKEVLYKTYTNKGFVVDTSSSEATIDGQAFEIYSSALYTPEGKLILNQDMYSCYRNGYDFGATLNYNDPINKEVMIKAWKASKFGE